MGITSVVAGWRRMVSLIRLIVRLPELIDGIRFSQGVTQASVHSLECVKTLRDAEYQVFSQWGEDGIIQFLTRTLRIKHRTFIEIGVEDFTESNCRFLMMKDNWRGFVVDSSERNIAAIRNSWYFWRYELRAVAVHIDAGNVEEVLAWSNFDPDIGLLSIDIDGNDYWVLKGVTRLHPRILVCEYNSVFGSDRAVTVPYDSNFSRSNAHSSNLYFGASLAALVELARSRGYAFIGTNSTGCNAFFVRRDLLCERVREVSIEEGYNESRFREARDQYGKLSFLGGGERIRQIRGLPVFNTRTSQIEPL